MTGVKITKVGADASVAPPAPQSAGKKHHVTRRKSMRTYPKGILKKGVGGATIKGVRDPAKAPPIRKGATKHTLRILTEQGAENHRKRIKKTIRNMPDHKVRETLQNAGMSVKSTTPIHIAKDILESGMEAGMIVVK